MAYEVETFFEEQAVLQKMGEDAYRRLTGSVTFWYDNEDKEAYLSIATGDRQNDFYIRREEITVTPEGELQYEWEGNDYVVRAVKDSDKDLLDGTGMIYDNEEAEEESEDGE